jgi:predicted NAD/FAD-dependent oxidoreductase
MDKKNYKNIVIGAGISGLNTARELNKNGELTIVLEKSRGFGGRLATRRTLDTTFDHGAQFYRLKESTLSLHQEYESSQLTNLWFEDNSFKHYCSTKGMTLFAKHLAHNLETRLEFLVQTIRFENNLWHIISDKGESILGERVVLSAPVPQALILLDKNQLHYPDSLNKINYTKALIALVTCENKSGLEKNYQENISPFFSIADQQSKKLSSISAFTFTMDAIFSEANFENTDEENLKAILFEINRAFPDLKIIGSELKKWRYCQVQEAFNELYYEVMPNLFLIGDGFGGASINGALRSSKALLQAIN